MSEFVIEATRGGLVEARHRVRVAVCDGRGGLVARAGDIDSHVPWRSAAKPFQAMAALAEGAFARFGWGEAEVALACASHSSEDRHVDLALSMLASLGLDASALACGPHRPLSERVARAMEREGRSASAVASNCSGKHAAMLALALHRGWSVEGYERAEHPVQRRCLAEVARWSGVLEGDISLSTDGCAVVCFGIPLRAMAAAYARLGHSADPAAHTVTRAMMARPELVGGEGRLCTELMRAFPGEVVAKVGAGGVYCAALLDAEIGLALKVEDGDWRAAEVALLGVLDAMHHWADSPTRRLAEFAEPAIRNTRGEVVGQVRRQGGVVRENAARSGTQR